MLAGAAAVLQPAQTRAKSRWLRLDKPIDRRQLMELPFGRRSHYVQPWRAYLDTPPASRLRSALGINFNVAAEEVDATARALGRARFKRARVDFSWASVDPARPDRLTGEQSARLHDVLVALKRRHIRPLLLLNSNSGNPAAARFFNVQLTSAVAAGVRTLLLAPADAAQLIPGRSGINAVDGSNKAAAYIVTSVRGPLVQLSRPLPKALPPGSYAAATLAYEPFRSPGTSQFDATMSGWRAYVRAVTREAKAVFGGRGFDVEIWNELTFGSDFLNVNNYYDPPVDPAARRSGPNRAVIDELIAATVREIRSAAMPGVGISDGFASQVPWPSGANEQPGVTAISKHYYKDATSFPSQQPLNGLEPVDAGGRSMGTRNAASGVWTDVFVPRYRAFLPEYWLTGIQTETLIRDLAPFTTTVYRIPHGRRTHLPGQRPPGVWMTEYNLTPPAAMTPAQVHRFRAKVVLRFLTAYVNKGLEMVTFYGAKGEPLGLIDPAFFSAARMGRPHSPGLALEALRRLTGAAGPPRRFRRRPLRLVGIQTRDRRTQFRGNGRFPTLRNLDVTAFFPFQRGSRDYLIAAYVMTRDVARPYGGAAGSPRRFDLPPRKYRFTVKGLGCRDRLRAFDPISGRPVRVRRVGCRRGRLTFEAPLTDWPLVIKARRPG